MTDSLTLYRTLMEFVWQNDIYIHDICCLATFVWAMVGLIESQKIHLSQWLVYRTGRASVASKYRQLSRWLHNPKINPGLVYHYLIQGVLRAWAGQVLYLALDSSSPTWRPWMSMGSGLIWKRTSWTISQPAFRSSLARLGTSKPCPGWV